MMLTVEDLLHIKAIDGIRLVAGENGRRNKISIVNIIENPEVFDWLRANELMLSTGYIFKDNEELQNRIIKELAEINCSGLVIKMKRYFDHIPQNMIDLANKYGFPILELPFEYTLSNVIAVINEKTNAEYDSWNRTALDVHNALFRIALEGGGTDQISEKLSKTINNPILIVDRDWRLIQYTEPAPSSVPIQEILGLERNRTVFPTEVTDTIPKQIGELKKSIKRIHIVDGQELKCRIMPIAVAKYVYGYIVVVQTIRELTEVDFVALEHASTIFALDRIKEREIEEVKLKIRQEFFDDLLTGKLSTSESIQDLCDLHGLKTSYKYYTIVIRMAPLGYEVSDNMVASKYELEQRAQKCVDIVYGLASKESGEITSFYRNNLVIILVGRQENREPITAGEASTFAHDMYKRLKQTLKNTDLHIGIGNQYKIQKIHKSFSEANESLRLMERFNDHKYVTHFQDFLVYHFLDSNIRTAEMEEYFKKCLGKLYEHDQQNDTDLMETLENYFAYNRNVSQAAKEMYIHRNTFTYRIDKIKTILNVDLNSSEELLQIQLALKAYRLLHK